MSIYADVITVLESDGPLSAFEVAERLGITVPHARAALGQRKARGACHISGWRRDDDGGVLYVRALYSAGPGKDAKKPPPLTQAEYQRRYKQRTRTSVNSVFALGETKRRVAFDWRSIGGQS